MEISLTNLKNEALTELLNDSLEVFDAIDNIGKQLRISDGNIQYYRETLDKLTSFYMYLNPVVKKITATKRNKELAYYHKLKIECEKNGDKFTDGSAKQESALSVANERTALAYFEAYIDSVHQAMVTCRGRIKEYYNVREVEGESTL